MKKILALVGMIFLISLLSSCANNDLLDGSIFVYNADNQRIYLGMTRDEVGDLIPDLEPFNPDSEDFHMLISRSEHISVDFGFDGRLDSITLHTPWRSNPAHFEPVWFFRGGLAPGIPLEAFFEHHDGAYAYAQFFSDRFSDDRQRVEIYFSETFEYVKVDSDDIAHRIIVVFYTDTGVINSISFGPRLF